MSAYWRRSRASMRAEIVATRSAISAVRLLCFLIAHTPIYFIEAQSKRAAVAVARAHFAAETG